MRSDPVRSETTATELERLCAATAKAIKCDRAADTALRRKRAAFFELRDLLGAGDLLAVIYNAQKRIGELMTEDK